MKFYPTKKDYFAATLPIAGPIPCKSPRQPAVGTTSSVFTQEPPPLGGHLATQHLNPTQPHAAAGVRVRPAGRWGAPRRVRGASTQPRASTGPRPAARPGVQRTRLLPRFVALLAAP